MHADAHPFLPPPPPPAQVLLLVVFNLVASSWLPRLQLGGSGTASGKQGGSARGCGKKGGKSGGGSVRSGVQLSRVERLYLWGLVPLELATSWVLPAVLGDRLPFLPLAAVSLYCSLGLLRSWARLAAQTAAA